MKATAQEALTTIEVAEEKFPHATVQRVGPNGDFGFVRVRRDTVNEHPKLFSAVTPEELFGTGNEVNLFVHISGIGGMGRGMKLTPQTELVLREITKGDKGYKVSFAQTIEAYEEEQQRAAERERYNRQVEERRLKEQEELEKERLQWEPMIRALQKIEAVITMGEPRSRYEYLLLTEAITARPEKESCLVRVITSTWDNDAKEVSTRPGARSYEVYSDERVDILIKGTTVAERRGTRTYTDNLQSPEKIRVSVAANVEPDYTKPAARWFTPGSTDENHVLYEAKDSESRINSSYLVSPEDARLYWQHCKWWELEMSAFEDILKAAQRVLEARRLWQESFPGTTPGDLDAVLSSNNLDPKRLNEFTNTFSRKDAFDIYWIRQTPWDIPEDIYRRNPEDIILERHKLLHEAATRGDEKSLRILEDDSYYLIRADLWESLQQGAIGYTVRQDYNMTDSYWDTARFEPKDTGYVPDYAAYWTDEGGGEHVVAKALIYQYIPGTKPYYRIYVDKDKINKNPFYVPGTLKWKAVETEE